MLFVTCAVIGAACASAAPDERGEKIDSWALTAAREFGDSLETIVGKLGEPRGRETQPGHDAADVFETLRYDGLSIATVRKEDDSGFAVVSVEAASPEYPLGGVRVGETSGVLTKIFGFPDQRTAREVFYRGNRSAVAAELEQGKITALKILFRTAETR
jgi:hypothetical protein